MKLISIFLAALVFIISCKEKPSRQPVTTDTDSATSAYLPVKDFIRNDIQKVDSFAGGILKRTDINDKKDSAFITLKAFHKLAGVFLLPDLDSATFRQNFTETSFMDEATQLLNFIYTTDKPDIPLRKVVVYVKPALARDQVNRVYIEQEYRQGDTVVQQKLTWALRKYFIILTIQQPAKGPVATSIQKIIWDPKQFSGT